MLCHRFRICTLTVLVALCLASSCVATSPQHILTIRGNCITLDGRRGQILYRASGDLNGDRRTETVFAMLPHDKPFTLIIVARRVSHGWQLIATHDVGYYSLRTDVTDVNGDGRAEIVARGISGDGHGWCNIYALRRGGLVRLGNFSDTKLRDLTGDGVPEVLSLSMVSFGFVGDHWLTIYKWNGRGYTDVSRRFPRAYDSVIRDLKRTMHDLRFTNTYGSKHNPRHDTELFSDLYYSLGKAYEYRGFSAKAQAQYAIARRLNPSGNWTVGPLKTTDTLNR